MTLGYVASANGKVTYNQLCDGDTLYSSQFASQRGTDTTSGLHRVTVLFQNSLRSCIPVLDQVTSFRFQSTGAASQVSFCMDNISLLPSTLQPAGKLAAWHSQSYGCNLYSRYVPTKKSHWQRIWCLVNGDGPRKGINAFIAWSSWCNFALVTQQWQ